MECWDAMSTPTVEKNMLDILWMLYLKVPSSVVSEDNQGLGSIEYAIDSNLGIKVIQDLQDTTRHFNETEAHKMAHRGCMRACCKSQRKNSPHAISAASCLLATVHIK